MTFVTAWLAAAGLGAMAIPILIHLLLRRRREPVRWAAMRLLRQAMREQSRRMRLEQLVVLALRCLLLGAAAAAVAQPLLRAAAAGEGRGGRVVFLVIDDGMVSGARDDRASVASGASGSSGPAAGTALAVQRATAERILESLAPGDAIGIVTAARPARGVLVPATTDLAAAANLLRAIEPSDAPTDLPAALTVLREAVDRVPEERPVAAYLLSDFRRGAAALDSALPQLFAAAPEESTGRELGLFATPAAESLVDNTQVVAITPLRRLILPGQNDGSGQVTVQLERYGALPAATTRVAVSGPGVQPTAPKSVRWEPGESEATVDVLVEPTGEGDAPGPGATDATATPAPAAARGAAGVVVQLDPDLLPADDMRAAVLQTRRSVRLVLLDRRSFNADVAVDRLSGGQWLARALRPSDASPLEVTVEDPQRVDGRTLRGVDAAVVARPDLLDDSGWSALAGLLARGGLVVVAPPDELGVHPWVDRMQVLLRPQWKVGLEATTVPEGLAFADNQPTTPLLRLLETELAELVKPVTVLRRLAIDSAAAPGDVVLVGADGSPLIVAGNPRGPDDGPSPGPGGEGAPPASGAMSSPGWGSETLPGILVLFAFAPELSWTDLPTKPLMVPLVQEIVRQGVGLGSSSTESTVGERALLPASAVDLVRLGAPREDASRAVDVSGGRSAPLGRAGLYQIRDGADQIAGLLAVNIEPRAGDTTPQAPDAVVAWLRGSGPWQPIDLLDPAAPLRQVEMGSSFAWILLVVALLAALLEGFLSKRFSRAGVRREDQPVATPSASPAPSTGAPA